MLCGFVRSRIALTCALIINVVYIFYPSKMNFTVEIRLACVVAIIAALAYVNVLMALRLVLFSVILGVLLVMLKDTAKKTFVCA